MTQDRRGKVSLVLPYFHELARALNSIERDDAPAVLVVPEGLTRRGGACCTWHRCRAHRGPGARQRRSPNPDYAGMLLRFLLRDPPPRHPHKGCEHVQRGVLVGYAGCCQPPREWYVAWESRGILFTGAVAEFSRRGFESCSRAAARPIAMAMSLRRSWSHGRTTRDFSTLDRLNGKFLTVRDRNNSKLAVR